MFSSPIQVLILFWKWLYFHLTLRIYNSHGENALVLGTEAFLSCFSSTSTLILIERNSVQWPSVTCRIGVLGKCPWFCSGSCSLLRSVTGGGGISFSHSGFIYSHCSTTLLIDSIVLYLLKMLQNVWMLERFPFPPIILETQNSNVGKKIRIVMSNNIWIEMIWRLKI